MTRTDIERRAVTERILPRLVEEPGPLDTPCMVWPGARSGNGYGYIRVGGRRGGRVVPVHLLVYRVLVGAPGRRKMVHHRCQNIRCARADHLEAVTATQHGLRHRRATCAAGHLLEAGNTVNGRRCRRCRNARRRANYRALISAGITPRQAAARV